MHFEGLVRKLARRCHTILHCYVHNYQYVILRFRHWIMWVCSLGCRSHCRTRKQSERVVDWWEYPHTAYVMPKIALVTDDGLISIFLQVVGRCHMDMSGDQLVVGHGLGGRHLIAKLGHRARGVRGLIWILVAVEIWVCNQVNIIWFSYDVRCRCHLTCPSHGCDQKYDDRKLRDLPRNVWPFGAHGVNIDLVLG